MSRRRMIDPSIWEDSDLGSLSFPARLLFIGMISCADDEGRGDASPLVLRRAVFGFDPISEQEVSGYLAEIFAGLRSVIDYEVDGRKYYYLQNWRKYQKLNRPLPARFPAPPGNLAGSRAYEITEFGAVFRKWEQASGLISARTADMLRDLILSWDEWIAEQPAGHPAQDINGMMVVASAIDEACASIARPNFNYVKAIVDGWKVRGYKVKPEYMSGKKEGTAKLTGKKETAAAYTAEELAAMKKKKKG